VKASHTLQSLRVAFDDRRLVSNAGLLLPATLGERLGFRQLVDEHVELGAVPGAANPGAKSLTVIASLLAGGDCIDHVDVLRAGRSAAVLGHPVAAASTVGTFLRAFTWGHARQLDVVSRELLARAWQAGAGPDGDAPLTIDVDSSICETYGLFKQGGSGFGYTHVRGYHPIIAVAAGTGDLLHARLRSGPANAGRGAGSFLAESFTRVRAAGGRGELTVRADSAFYNGAVVRTCRRHDVRFSITVRLSPTLHAVIATIPDDAWTPIPYFLDGADVAETTYRPFSGRERKPVRLIVRRVRPTPGTQLALFTAFSYHAFITDRSGGTLELEADHRRHAEVENTIRDLKYGVGLNHLPSGRFAANAAWLALNTMAHNLARWTSRLGLGETLITTKTLRHHHLALPGRMTRSGRRDDLHLPTWWPWRSQFLTALSRLRCLRPAPQPA
jgi:Transposase DDE domain group 1